MCDLISAAPRNLRRLKLRLGDGMVAEVVIYCRNADSEARQCSDIGVVSAGLASPLAET